MNKAVRANFPLLIKRPELVYLDGAATSLKPKSVIDKMGEYYTTYGASVHRGLYTIAEEATQEYEQIRQKTAQFVHAKDPSEIIFTKSATESLNLVAKGLSGLVKAGDEIVVTAMEHHSNFVPWQELARTNRATFTILPITPSGILAWRPENFTKRTKIVAVTQVSNVLGTINPVKEIVRAAHKVGAIAVIDGAQAVGHLPVDVLELDADCYAFSGHKMYGPTGVGVLYGKRKLLEAMPPFLLGGAMVKEVTLEKTSYADLPAKFEAGTPPVAEVIGLGAALDYLTKFGMEVIREHEVELTTFALKKLGEAGVEILGPLNPTKRGGLIAWHISGIHAHDEAQVLAAHGICLRSGHHCAMPLHSSLGISASTRASFSLFSTRHDVRRLIIALGQAHELLRLPERKPTV